MPHWISDAVQRSAETLSLLWVQALEIWVSGGWAMWAIAAVSLLMFGLGFHILLSLRRQGHGAVPERIWRTWVRSPEARRGPVGQLLEFVLDAHSVHDVALRFRQVRATVLVPFERDLRIMRICVNTAPLVGLLGTVTGMLATFAALSSGSGGDKTMGLVASGISEALITTETGLVIALPGLFFRYRLTRDLDRYKAFLAHLESVCAQSLYRRKSLTTP